jgi:hypothetical protein
MICMHADYASMDLPGHLTIALATDMTNHARPVIVLGQ